jgi:hypothetical protein
MHFHWVVADVNAQIKVLKVKVSVKTSLDKPKVVHQSFVIQNFFCHIELNGLEDDLIVEKFAFFYFSYQGFDIKLRNSDKIVN